MEKVIHTGSLESEKIKKRDPYFQIIRGLCICAVILIHCYAIGRNSFENYYLIVVRNMENFAVGIFIFMAGYFAKPMIMRGGTGIGLKS